MDPMTRNRQDNGPCQYGVVTDYLTYLQLGSIIRTETRVHRIEEAVLVSIDGHPLSCNS